jgi:hypothetical protein
MGALLSQVLPDDMTRTHSWFLAPGRADGSGLDRRGSDAADRAELQDLLDVAAG